jgi:hypothetical protein
LSSTIISLSWPLANGCAFDGRSEGSRGISEAGLRRRASH